MTEVRETREIFFDIPRVKRRRHCPQCDERLTTYEINEDEWRVLKALPRKEPTLKKAELNPARNDPLANAIRIWGT